MTPKEKAQELIDKFREEQPIYQNEDDEISEIDKHDAYFGRRCALICVEEVIKQISWWHETSSYNETTEYEASVKELEFWNEVQLQIKNYKI